MKALYFPSTVGAENRNSESCFSKKLLSAHFLVLRFLIFILFAFAVSYTESVENTCTEIFQSFKWWGPLLWNIFWKGNGEVLYCWMFFERKPLLLSTDPWKITEIAELYYSALVTSPVKIRFLHKGLSFCFSL